GGTAGSRPANDLGKARCRAFPLSTDPFARLSVQRFQLVDEAFDHGKPLAPEVWVGGVKAKWCQQFRMVLGAASLQKLEILVLKTLVGILVDSIERIYQAIAERVGIDVERRVDEVRDIGPERLIALAPLHCRSHTGVLNREPQLPQLF